MDKILGKRRIDSFFNENENITFDPEMVVEKSIQMMPQSIV